MTRTLAGNSIRGDYPRVVTQRLLMLSDRSEAQCPPDRGVAPRRARIPRSARPLGAIVDLGREHDARLGAGASSPAVARAGAFSASAWRCRARRCGRSRPRGRFETLAPGAAAGAVLGKTRVSTSAGFLANSAIRRNRNRRHGGLDLGGQPRWFIGLLHESVELNPSQSRQHLFLVVAAGENDP